MTDPRLPPATPQPDWRKPVGVFAILALIATWAILIASLSTTIQQWPALVEALFYLVSGLVWVAPLKPLLRWIERGHLPD